MTTIATSRTWSFSISDDPLDEGAFVHGPTGTWDVTAEVNDFIGEGCPRVDALAEFAFEVVEQRLGHRLPGADYDEDGNVLAWPTPEYDDFPSPKI